MSGRWLMTLAVALMAATFVRAAEPASVEIVIGAENPRAAGNGQQWLEVLREVGIEGLQVRQRAPGEDPEIVDRGTKSSPAYHVYGVLTIRNELIVPGHQFSVRDRDAIADWLKELREKGIDQAAGGSGGPFGLSAKQLDALRADLARPVALTTVDMTPTEALTKLPTALEHDLALDPACKAALREAEPNREELAGLATGTSLTYMIRSAGLVLEPVASRGRVVLTVRPTDPAREAWPVGFEPDAKPEKLVPDFYEFLTVEIEDTAANEVLASLGDRLKLPLLYDHYALARNGIDLNETKVNLPEKRMTYSMVLKKVLQQAKLTYELRVDEADKPFLWITTQAPAR